MGNRTLLHVSALILLAFVALAACGQAPAPSDQGGQQPDSGQSQNGDQPAPGSEPQQVDTVRFGILQANLGSLVLSLPEVEDKYNLKNKIVNFRDSTSALLALDQGEIDIANTTIQHLVRVVDEDMDAIWVHGWGGGYSVFVIPNDVPLEQDDWTAFKKLVLERKQSGNRFTIGVSTGSVQHLNLMLKLKEIGLDPDNDVEILNSPYPDTPRALESGQLDSVFALAPFAALAIEQGVGKLFSHVTDVPSGEQEIGFIVRKELVENNPDLVQRIVSANVEAMDSVINDLEKMFRLEMEYSGLPEPVIRMTYGDFLRINHEINLPGLKQAAKDTFELGWVQADYSDEIENYVDASFHKKATEGN